MSADAVDRIMQRMEIRREQLDVFESIRAAHVGDDLPNKFAGIRKIYELQWPYIERDLYDPYFADWCSLMTPIEFDVWISIRSLGLHMYPQFPAGRYFADFADPHRRRIIECDGKQWHNEEKDRKRDAALLDMGWHVLRIPGWRCRLGEFDPRGSHQLIRGEYGFGPSEDPFKDREEEWF